MSKQPTETPADVRKRKWWLALLSILAGFGYLYVGRPVRYWLFLAFSCSLLALLYFGPSSAMSDPSVAVTLGLVAVLVSIAMLIDVVRLAIKQPDYKLKWFNRWWVYLAGSLLATSLSFIPDVADKEALAVRSYSIPSESNLPTLKVGEYVTGNPAAYETTDPQRGDVVVFKLPSDNETDYVKRVVGLPEDRVQMVDGVLHINGLAVPRRQVGTFTNKNGSKTRVFEETLPNGVTYRTLDTYAGSADNTAEYGVPKQHYFVMGDNRDNSTDSRFLNDVGYVPRKNIYVKVGGVIYSPDWSRIGTVVK